MSKRVFIDGHAGTTGLRIRDWLSGRDDLELLEVDEQHRKDPAARREGLEAAEIAVLCLPDVAAAEAASWLLLAALARSSVVESQPGCCARRGPGSLLSPAHTFSSLFLSAALRALVADFSCDGQSLGVVRDG